LAKIVHVCRVGWPSIGGMERFVHQLAKYQRGQGIDASVLTLATDARGELLPEGEHEGVPYRRIRRVGHPRYPGGRGLVRALRGVDLVHCHGLDLLTDKAIVGKKLHGAKVAVSTHGGFFHRNPESRRKALFLHTVTRTSLMFADAVWFTSETDRQRIGRAVHGRVVPNALDLSPWQELERDPTPGRWVAIGRVDEHKGIDDLLCSLGALAARDPRPFTLEIIGSIADPVLRDAYMQIAEDVGIATRVVFRGRVSDDEIHEALQGAEFAFFPSRSEGFGLGVVEAMAAGIAPVLSPIDAFRSLARDGVDSDVVDFRDPDTAAVRLASIRGSDRSVKAQRARKAAAAHDWSAVGPRWMDAVSRLGVL